ncbi:MAG: extracellular solute-binding protein [Candidatus Komeilibacteria bacterium]|nr:extracellular solute-binding protein [Candidatus Komeilibacteria bacterium]
MKKFLLLFALLTITLTTSGFSCKLNPFASSDNQQLLQPVTLEYWTVDQSTDNLKELLSQWRSVHPNIIVNLKRFRAEEYEQKLLEGWAQNKGPDVYSLPNTWLRKYGKFITPMPGSIQLAFQEITKTLGKEDVVTTIKKVTLLSPAQISRNYLQAVTDDVVWGNKVYGLPISFDTLALFYNQKLLDAVGLPVPPATWTEVKEAVKKLTLLEAGNKIKQAGIALGTANNIPQAVNIAIALMIQNGVQMSADNGSVTFNQTVKTGDQTISPALDALNFYTDFADPLKETYSWNKDLATATDLFLQGKLAMFLGLASELANLKNRAPKLDIKVAPLPQIAGASTPLNVGQYWVETVSKQTKQPEAAWGLVWFLTQSPNVEKILAKTGQAAALRSLIDQQKRSDQDVSVFAEQSLTAKTWYRGVQPEQMEKIFLELITTLPQAANQQQLINQTTERLNQTLIEPK